MKNFKKIFILGLFVALLMTNNVNAEELVTSVDTSDELVACLTQKGVEGTCELAADVKLSVDATIIVPVDSKIVLDLNGKNLELPDIGYAYPIATKGLLTVDGEGTVDILGEYGIQVGLGGVLNIKNGTFNQEVGTYIVGNYGTTTIEGGTFNGDYCTVNSFEYNGTNYYITIKGGTFNSNELEVILGDIIVEGGTYNQDISEIKAENYEDTDFVIEISDGYVLREEENLYKVYKELNIDFTPFENGAIQVSCEHGEYVEGDVIEVGVSPDEGYVLDLLEVKDVNGNAIKCENEKFVMPNSDVVITVVFVKNEVNVDIPFLDMEEEVDEVTVGVQENEELENVLNDSLDANEELKELSEKQNVTISVETSDVDVEKLDEKVQEAFEELAGKDEIVEFFDLSVTVRDTKNGDLLGNLSELTKEIEITVLLPESLKNADDKVERTYYVITRHVLEDGKATMKKLPATLSEDGKMLTFKTKEFSTYAIAYNDTTLNADVANPNTYDGINTTILVSLLSLTGLVGAVIYLTKKNNVKVN